MSDKPKLPIQHPIISEENRLSDEELKAQYHYLYSDTLPEEMAARYKEPRDPLHGLVIDVRLGEPLTAEQAEERWANMRPASRATFYDFVMRPSGEATMSSDEYAKLLTPQLALHRKNLHQFYEMINRDLAASSQQLYRDHFIGGRRNSGLDGGLSAGELSEGIPGSGGGGGQGIHSGGTWVVPAGVALKDGVMVGIAGGGGGAQGAAYFGGGIVGMGGGGGIIPPPQGDLLEQLIRQRVAQGEEGKKNILDTLIAVLGFADIMAAIKNARAGLNLTIDDVYLEPPEGATPTGTTVQDDSDFAHIPEAEGEHMDIKGEIERWLDAGKASRAVTLCHWDCGILMKKTIFTEEGDAVTLLYAPNDKSANPEP